MHEWVGSDIVTGGLDEPTLEREGKYPPIAEEPFNGTMLTVQAVRGALGTDHPGRGGIVAERWEVGSDRAAEFDGWLEGHLSRYEALDGWVRLRILHGDRTAEHRFPWNRYLGKGNRMVLAELREGVDPKAFVRARPPMARCSSTRCDGTPSFRTRPGRSGSASSSRTSATSRNPAGSASAA